MMDKRILPESFDFGIPSVDIIGAGRGGLDKTAMVKRASVFDDVIADLKPEKNRTYLHVITTGAMEKYGANLNKDAFNEDACEHACPYPEEGAKRVITLGGGLKAYHDKSYMSKEAAVYQEHRSSEEPSGSIVASRYNDLMKRGELLIAVDTDKWSKRLQKKASGQNIYLSMGCRVPYDICAVCHHKARTMNEHCGHFKKLGRAVMDDGTQNCVINDEPEFYDISGVDVPADKIAFVLNKVASGEQPAEASAEARWLMGSRTPMLLTRSAAVLAKMAGLEKRLESFVESGKSGDDDEAFKDDSDAQKTFVIKVTKYPADEVIDGCNRKGILLSPGMLFGLLGSECSDDAGREALCSCGDGCCGDCSAMMRELEDDDESRNSELLDGSFDQHFPVDIGLDRLLESFMPDFGMTNPAVGSRTIRITITGRIPSGKKDVQVKEASLTKRAQDALRRTYARYFLSFAAQNSEETCMNALRKIAGYGRNA